MQRRIPPEEMFDWQSYRSVGIAISEPSKVRKRARKRAWWRRRFPRPTLARR